MKRFLAGLTAICLGLSTFPVAAESLPFATIAPLSGYTLRRTDGEMIVFAAKSLKANIAGTITWDTPDIHVLDVQGEWCCISFPTANGIGFGYLPLSAFDVAVQAPAATPSPAPEFTTGTMAWVLNSGIGYRVNLREQPSDSATSLGKYYTGTPVTLTGPIENGFAQILLAGTLCWLDIRFLTTDAQQFVPETPMLSVAENGANLRAAPSSSAERLDWLSYGTLVTVLGVRADGWYHVMANDQIGYVSASLLSGTFPYDYGTDSDDPLLNAPITDGTTVLYLNTRSAGGQLHLRKEPSTGAKSLGVFYTGTPVTIISYTRTGWVYLRIGHLEGYMDADYLASVKPTQCGEIRTVRNSQTSGLNLRSLPSTGGEILDYLKNYTQVTVLGDLSDGWCYVLYGDVYGYMLGTSLKKTN